MIGPAARFWLLILSIAGTLSAAALLIVSSFPLGAVFGETDTVASVLVALVSLAVLVWSLSTTPDTSGS
jgi:O-antigen/teichoic acid export membrane protein